MQLCDKPNSQSVYRAVFVCLCPTSGCALSALILVCVATSFTLIFPLCFSHVVSSLDGNVFLPQLHVKYFRQPQSKQALTLTLAYVQYVFLSVCVCDLVSVLVCVSVYVYMLLAHTLNLNA